MMSGQLANLSTENERNSVQEEILRLAEAMVNGSLDERGNPDDFEGDEKNLIAIVNRMLDALVSPLRLAANTIDQVSRGKIPRFLIDDYKGEYNNLKLNINTLLATLYGLDNETRNLIEKIKDGKLRTRGNDWDFKGIWRDLINGLNGTLDAVIDPVIEAEEVLEQLSNFDLRARMRGQYRGEHAMIKKAINGTAESLHSAIAQVADSAESVTKVGEKIAENSLAVKNGADDQDKQVTEASKTLAVISASSATTAENTRNASTSAKKSVESISAGKKAMERMLSAMGEIRSAADNTKTIVHEMDNIAKEADELSSSAAEKAQVVSSSSRGFGIVATEIRTLAKRCNEAADRLDFLSSGSSNHNKRDCDDNYEFDDNDEMSKIIDDLLKISKVSHYLGLNASVAAAHVEGAGERFEIMTGEIGRLAKRSADAARKTEQLINLSVDFARKGEEISREIDGQLAEAVHGGNLINRLTDEISGGSQEQALSIEGITRAVNQIKQVTLLNTSLAGESAESALILEKETRKLSDMVNKFRIDRNHKSA